MFDGSIRQIPLQIDDNSIIGFCAIGPDETMHPCVFDTGAEYTIVPQQFWGRQFTRKELDRPEYLRVKLRTSYGHVCRARRIPVRIQILGIGGKTVDPSQNLIDFGTCEVNFVFDEDNADSIAAQYQVDLLEWRAAVKAGAKAPEPRKPTFEPLSMVYIGLGGGTFRNGGLCINWAKPEAVLVEQLEQPTTSR